VRCGGGETRCWYTNLLFQANVSKQDDPPHTKDALHVPYEDRVTHHPVPTNYFSSYSSASSCNCITKGQRKIKTPQGKQGGKDAEVTIATLDRRCCPEVAWRG
jgi:hypothetical protein